MCNFTYMETQAPALPVPPLPDEQKAAIHFRVESILESLPTELAGDGWPESHLTYDGVGLALEGLLAENTRLSLLLEEERRTGGEQPVFVQCANKMPEEGKAVLLQPEHEFMAPAIGRLQHDKHGQYWQVNGQRSTRYALENYLGWIYLPKKPAAPTCQRDCQKCEKAVSFFPCVACGAKAAPECLGDSCEYSTSVLPGGGAGVGLQGEEGGGRG